ncbi:hypothetical protein Acr_07g0010850 [Actinidia rufa]|uniref:Uncharacterized protein n=1 Tax=Actinidia rufa TaxID=165716 RepID=A0A7J0EY51_9ERIC|nr:hypothetical protein Acr_07g0010850 [Actinidia rufa]
MLMPCSTISVPRAHTRAHSDRVVPCRAQLIPCPNRAVPCRQGPLDTSRPLAYLKELDTFTQRGLHRSLLVAYPDTCPEPYSPIFLPGFDEEKYFSRPIDEEEDIPKDTTKAEAKEKNEATVEEEAPQVWG